jgi:hypothetical protein
LRPSKLFSKKLYHDVKSRNEEELIMDNSVQRVLDHLAAANRDANPELMRLALKLATGAGKTTVMFPWTVSDFSLMDAIECRIVKLPRVPVAENIPGNEMPMFRNLWENIRKDMPTPAFTGDTDVTVASKKS